MPDQRRHRGCHPEDARLFAPEAIDSLRRAVTDLSWLLSRGYATPSSLKLVGDRYNLAERQRVTVMRSACSDEALRGRLGRQIDLAALRGRPLLLDGYNVLTSVETALAGGVVLVCRDRCYRDMASIHGTYRKVEETPPALTLLGSHLQELGVSECIWYLDSPISNSGRLKGLMEQLAHQQGWPWRVELVLNPDAVLWQSPQVVATADSVVLDRCQQWANLAREVISRRVPQAWVVDVSREE